MVAERTFNLLSSLIVTAVLCQSEHEDMAFRGISFGDEAIAKARSPETVMRLHMMPEKGLEGMGAVCLDGSDAGFYFAPATDAANANNWQIHFQGGGWCYDAMDCWGRSNGGLGSSKSWSKTASAGGIMSDNCNVNPDFCKFNRVHMAYCDGNSFSGNRDEPLVVTGLDGKRKALYFRGKRILDATLETLMTMGLGSAESVLLTGCSAGGLATYLHTDYVHDRLRLMVPSLVKFKSAPISGFFILHKTVEGKPVYPTEMKEIFAMSNATHGLNEACIAAHEEPYHWQCNFAEKAYAYTRAPIFPLNSALDSWQTRCIYASELVPGFPHQNTTDNGLCNAARGWVKCSRDLETCTAEQTDMMNAYIKDFSSIIRATTTYSKAGNGAFLHSCQTHCEAQTDEAWNFFKVDGVTMQQAFSKWWAGDDEKASAHTYTPCLLKSASSPHQCNPSCGSGVDTADLLAV